MTNPLKYFLFFGLLSVSCLSFSTTLIADDAPPLSSQLQIQLAALKAATSEPAQLDAVKKIHDILVVAADGTGADRKALVPLLPQVHEAINAGQDKPFLEGQLMYLASAVRFFNQAQQEVWVEAPESQWLPLQTEATTKSRIMVFPDKILLNQSSTFTVIVQATNIHEAVISSDGRRVAFFRLTDGKDPTAEVWVYAVKKKKLKKIADIPSCHTLLFSLNGKTIYAQAKVLSESSPAALYRFSAGGSTPKEIGRVGLLQTLVREGDHKGSLVVYMPRWRPLSTKPEQCPVLLSPSGRYLGNISDVPCL